jgi:hypothetical protein
MDSQLQKIEACLGKTEATDLEANPEEVESKAKHEEIPKEEASVETSGALEQQHGEPHLVIRCCSQLKKQTQVNGGSQKKLATARGWLVHCAEMSEHKGHCCEGQGKNKVMRRTQKE